MTVLELGCGTGRVLIPLVQACNYIHGVDVSAAMISLCREKLTQGGIPATRASLQVGDITALCLSRTFNLIIAPFRVFQNLEKEAETDGFFNTVKKHLAAGGTCVLNVFNPYQDPAAMRREWVKEQEYSCWETQVEDERITCQGRNARMNKEKLILYPELIYRRYRGKELQEEEILKIVMRCYYPEDFEHLITGHGFEIVQRWGGYAGEPYGEGPELVIEFREGR